MLFASLIQEQYLNCTSFLVPFMIDPKTGIVNVSRVLDISESEHYSLPVEVTDGLWKATVSFHTFLHSISFLE